MKIYTYNSNGQETSVSHFTVNVPLHVDQFVEDKVALDLKQKDIDILNGETSVEKSLLVNKLRLIIKNDYQNFIDYIKDRDCINSFHYENYGFEHSFISVDREMIENLQSIDRELNEYLSRESSNESLEREQSLRFCSSMLSYIKEYTDRRCYLAIDGLKQKEMIYKIKKYRSKNKNMTTIKNLRRLVDYLSGHSFSFNNDEFVDTLAKVIYWYRYCRVPIYVIMRYIEYYNMVDDILHNLLNNNSCSTKILQSNDSMNFVAIKQQKRNDTIRWKIEFDDKEIISILLSDSDTTEIGMLKDKLEAGYNEFQIENGEYSSTYLESGIRDYVDSGNPSYEQWEQFYFYKRKHLVNVHELTDDKVREIPTGHYIVLLKNDVFNKLYSFNNVFVQDILSISGQEISNVDFFKLYEKMYELNYIKKKIGITIYNDITKTSVLTLNTEKLSTNKNEALQKILFFLEPILNDTYLVDVKQKDKIKDFLKDLILSEAVTDKIFTSSHKNFRCFYLKLVCNIIGFLFDPVDLSLKKPENDGAIIFKGNSYDLMGALITYHKLKIDQSNFSKYIRNHTLDDSELTKEIKHIIKELYKKYF